MKKIAQNSIGYRIRYSRDMCRMTQDEVATALDISKRTLIVWEKNERLPKASMLQNLAEVLNVDVSYLVGKEPQKSITTNEKGSEAMYQLKYENCMIENKIQSDQIISLYKEISALKDELLKKPIPSGKKKQA